MFLYTYVCVGRRPRSGCCTWKEDY